MRGPLNDQLLFRLGPVIFVVLWSGGFTAVRLGLLDSGPLTFLVARYLLVLAVLPLLGGLRPDKISFLPSMRYYAGNWATTQWLFRKGSGAEEKLDTMVKKPARIIVEQVGQIYAATTTPWQRLERFIRGTCDCYARGDGWLHAARREADLIPAMNRAVEVQEKSNEVMVRAAFAGYQVDEETIPVLKALTDFPFWRSLTRGGMTHAQAVEVICGLVMAELEKK